MANLSTSAKILRLSRAQFLPVILSPIFAGTALAWWATHTINPLTFLLTVLAGIGLHLGANAIDDAFDYQSGVDVLSNDMFPPDFGGWKPLPRGMLTLGQAKRLSYAFFMFSILVGLYLAYLVGPLIVVFGAIGLFFAYYHVAPPLKLAYRGLALGEIGIFLSFGVLPVAGSFFVQTGSISIGSIIVGIPIGLLTTNVLINHDQVFFDAYSKSGKKSYAVVVGRRAALATTLTLTSVSYLVVASAALLRLIPVSALVVLLTLPLFVMEARLALARAESPLHYVKLLQTAFALSVLFGFLLAFGLALG